MKKYIAIFVLAVGTLNSFAQNNNSNNVFIRHDTTLLNAAECEWIVRSLVKNDPAITSAIGRSIPQLILKAIENGKLKAVDRVTDKPIPGKEIYTWGRQADSIPAYDVATGNTKLTIVQRRLSPANITHIRIYHDWNANISTGKLQSVIKWIELLEDVYTSSTGMFIGYAPLCRIYY